MVPKHHLIISGTGRAGTTFLIQLLTQLGLDTGYTDLVTDMYQNCDAGMERDLRQPDAPYVVKSPWMCEYLADLLRTGRVVIDHAVVPVRDLYSAAESRRSVTARSAPGEIAGGLWDTANPTDQETVLTRKFYDLMQTIAEHDIPVTLLAFPRTVKDPEYLYAKLATILPGVGRDEFLRAYGEVCRPTLIHDFNRQAA